MKKISEKYYIEYFIVFIIFCVVGIALLAFAVMHPRPQNILLVLIDGVMIHLNKNWMNRAKCANLYDYNKEVKSWNNRKKEAECHGEIFEEPKPARPRKMGMQILPMFIIVLVAGFHLYVISSMYSILFSLHMPYEYKDDIAYLRSHNYDAYCFFPDEFPEGAAHVRWYIMPSFMQARGITVLIFDAPEEFIQEVIDTYGEDAVVCEVENDMKFRTYYDKARWKELVVYVVHEKDTWDHTWGFVVDEELGQIGYYYE